MTPGAPITTPWVATVSETDGPVSVRIALQLVTVPAPDQVAFWGEVLGTFFHCAAEGCFCLDPKRVAPSAAPLEVEDAEKNVALSTQVAGVDTSAWQVLVAMVLAAGRYFMPVQSFQLTVQSAQPVPVLDGPKLIAKPYPALRKLAFPLDDQRGGPGNLATRGETRHDVSLVLFAPGGVAKTCSTPGTAAFRLLPRSEKSFAIRRAGFHHGLLASWTSRPSTIRRPLGLRGSTSMPPVRPFSADCSVRRSDHASDATKSCGRWGPARWAACSRRGTWSWTGRSRSSCCTSSEVATRRLAVGSYARLEPWLA